MSSARGAEAERRAAEYLLARGFSILDRCFRAAGGEIDLVARDGGSVVFVEVKARSSNAFGGPLAAVTRDKRRRLARAAASYLALRGLSEAPARFDVVAVTPLGIEHVADAFRPGEP